MPTTVPFLRIEQELPSQLKLVSPSRRWLILVIAVMAAMPLSLLGFLILMANGDILVAVPLMTVGFFLMMLLLLFVPIQFHLGIGLNTRMLTLNKQYWLGFGALERTREIAWSFNEITEINLVSNKLIEIEANGKKVLVANFNHRSNEAQHSYRVLESWRRGLALDSNEAKTILNTLAGEKQNQSALKNAENLLKYFGVFSLIGGALGFYTDNALTSSSSIPTLISLSTGLIYLACGYGAKRRFEPALWVAILVVLAERFYWFIMSGTLSGEGNWSSWLTWVFAIFVVSNLWQAIQSIRAKREEPVYEPL